MRINGFQAVSAAERAGATRATDDPPARRDRPADMLRDATDQKALAEARLERARQFLDMLERWNFPPDVVARQAEALGVEVRSALQQYASRAGDGEAGDAGASFAWKADVGGEAQEEPDETPPHRSFVERAYLEAMDGSGEPGTSSAEDRRILAAFRGLLREIGALQERAEREAGRTDEPPGADVAPISPGRRGPGAG